MPKHIEIRYYESFAKTHQGHGTDVAIVGGAMGYSTFDSRIKSSLDIAKMKILQLILLKMKEKVLVNILTVLISKQIRKTDVI